MKQSPLSEAMESCVVLRKLSPPPPTTLPLPDALKTMGAAEEADGFRRLLQELVPLETMAAAPILAVMGSLNSGKSSCVAGMLSPAGAERVLRGTLSSEATNRFVVWLPQKWDDRAIDGPLWKSVQAQLAPAFGSSIAFLAENPAEAHKQYLNAEGGDFNIPLIAFDQNLDALNICLLDCPDFESRTASQHASDRLKVVEHAAGIIHAVIYVVESSGVRKESLAGMAGLLNVKLANRPKFLAINLLRHSNSPVEKRLQNEDVLDMQRTLGATKVFVAYDFEARSNEGRLPVEAAKSAGIAEGFPWFFEPALSPEKNLPEALTTDRMLVSHLARIQSAKLWENAITDKKAELRVTLAELRKSIAVLCAEHRNELKRCRQDLIDFISAQMTGANGGLKIPFTSHLLKQLSESLLRTAPVYARPVLHIKGHVGAFRSFVASRWDAARKIWITTSDPGASLRQEIDAGMNSRLRTQKGRSLVVASDLARKAAEAGLSFEDASADQVETAWGKVLNAMQEMSDTLSNDALDRVTRDIWKAIPAWKKALLGAAGPVIAVGGLIVACLALVDMGMSAVILSSSTMQLLSFLGVGTAATFVGTSAAVRLDELLKKNVGVPAYCRAVATACDVFGLPREIDEPLIVDFKDVPRTRVSLAGYPHHEPVVEMSKATFSEEIPEGWHALEQILES